MMRRTNFFIKSTDENCPVEWSIFLPFLICPRMLLSDEDFLNCCSYYFCKGKWYFLNIELPADIANYRSGQSVWPPPNDRSQYAGIVGLWSVSVRLVKKVNICETDLDLMPRHRFHSRVINHYFTFQSKKVQHTFHNDFIIRERDTFHSTSSPRLLVLLYSSEMLFDSFTSVWPVLHNTTQSELIESPLVNINWYNKCCFGTLLPQLLT